MNILYSIVSEEMVLKLIDPLKDLKKHDEYELLKKYRVVNYAGVKFDEDDGYYKLSWDVER